MSLNRDFCFSFFHFSNQFSVFCVLTGWTWIPWWAGRCWSSGSSGTSWTSWNTWEWWTQGKLCLILCFFLIQWLKEQGGFSWVSLDGWLPGVWSLCWLSCNLTVATTMWIQKVTVPRNGTRLPVQHCCCFNTDKIRNMSHVQQRCCITPVYYPQAKLS